MSSPTPSDAARRMAAITSIGRPLDPGYPSNIAIMILSALSALAFAALTLWQGQPLGSALIAGLLGGFAPFGPWMLCREGDPDRPWLAFAGAALGIAALALRGPYAALSLYALVSLARIVNRTVGPSARVGDSLVTLLVVGLAAFWGGDAAIGLASALVFALDAALPGGRPRQWIFAGLSLGLSLAVLLIRGLPPLPPAFEFPWLPAALITALIFALAILFTREIRSLCDLGDRPIQPARVRAAMAAALLYALLMLAYGQPGLDAALPVWGSLLAMGLLRWVEPAPARREG